MTSLADSGRWEEALRAFDSMPPSIELNEALLNAAVGAAALGQDSERCLSLLDMAVAQGVTPRTSSFNMALQMSSKGKPPGVALAILRKMRWVQRDPSPPRRDPSPARRDPSPARRDPSPARRDPSRVERGWMQEGRPLCPCGMFRTRPPDPLALACWMPSPSPTGSPRPRPPDLPLTRAAPRVAARAAGARANLLTYNSALTAMAGAGRWRHALLLLAEMKEARVKPTLISCNLALSACAKASERDPAAAGDAALELLSSMGTRFRLKPDTVSYSSAIAALSRTGNWERVFGVIGAVHPDATGGSLNSFSWSSAIAACERAGDWQKGVALFNGLRQSTDVPLTEGVYNAAISAAGCGGDVAQAVAFLNGMEGEGLAPSLRSYNACLKACERAADWSTAFDIFVGMKAGATQPDAISFTSVVGALGRAGEWEKALGVWTQMECERVEPDSMALHTLLRALTTGGQWEKALQLFEDSLAAGVPASRSSLVFAAAITACAAGRQARRATEMLDRMAALEPPLVPSAACFHAASQACAAAGEWRGALAVFQQTVRIDMRPHPEMWRVVLDACRAADQTDEANQLLAYAERVGVPLIAMEE